MELAPTVYYHGKKSGFPGACVVSVREMIRDTAGNPTSMTDALSPSYIQGSGNSYPSALQDFIDQLDEYIECLKKFREEVLGTPKAYTDVVGVDFAGKMMR